MSGSASGEDTRSLFIEHLRQIRHDLLRPGLGAGEAAGALALLGLDDAALGNWAAADATLVSLPHASPNVFFPRAMVGWFAGTLTRAGTHHARITLTHTNFSDLGWRPYAWWYLDEAGVLRRHRIFSRNKKRKHVVVSSQPPLDASPPRMAGADLRAARAASLGADLSVSCLLIAAVTERAAGLAHEGNTTYVPLTALVSFARKIAARADSSASGAWCSALLAGSRGRRAGPDGTLHSCPAADADVFDNYGNLASLCLLGRVRVLGGKKMAGYWPDVSEVIGRCGQAAAGAMPDPEVLVVPDNVDLGPLAPSAAVAAQLSEHGIPYSQAMAVAEHGDFAARRFPVLNQNPGHD